jgi:hypothetical protein
MEQKELPRLVQVTANRFDLVDLSDDDCFVGVHLDQTRQFGLLPIQVLAAAPQVRQRRLEDPLETSDLVGRKSQIPLELIHAPPGETSGLGGRGRRLRQGPSARQAGRHGYQPGAQQGPSSPPNHR